MGKGYKAGFASLQGDFVTITGENVDTIPKELGEIVKSWKEYAEKNKESYYERGGYCPVKGASEIFRYEDVNYKILPSFFGIDGDYFEYLMLRHIEDELVEIGAEGVFCTAVLD